MEQELAKVYDPHAVEDKWYEFWTERNYFSPDSSESTETYTIVIPPPNVTGSLHMGHALNNTLQDISVRFKRMQGFKVLWLPGTDHAGIATQNVVEKMLAAEGSSREAIGREAFLEKVWEWKVKYGTTIIDQLKKLGSSCDWSRERFTMDDRYSQAVKKVFVDMFNDGLIYKDRYIINWCPRCTTALSDIEVEHEDVHGKLWHILYPLKDGSGHIRVATTRPETMLGDVAVAVNPKDERYSDLIGKIVLLPLVDREVPIIADDFVDPEFGSGAVKVTPGHDPNDFEMGRRHNLPKINIFTDRASLNDEVPEKYRGHDRYKARKLVVDDLEDIGLLEKIEEHPHSVGHCYRCKTVIEPYLSMQWFVKMRTLADAAVGAVKRGDIKFLPSQWEKTYFDWMDNIRDWCISRQIWWGHQIPVWYCEDCDHYQAAMEPIKVCPNCRSTNLRQDEDVLDTWFSSQLWPFATLGWPEDTEDLRNFYPTSVLITAHDIIFFWVARMIMAGLYCMKQPPFDTVYIHTLIRDIYGKKMSKSFGNVIDPLVMIEQYGTDALRYTLANLALPGRDIFLSEEKIEFNRNFANKIWNASRFVLMNVQDMPGGSVLPDKSKLNIFDRWILNELNRAIRNITAELEGYSYAKASRLLYDLIWSEFCDWYIEVTKPRLYQTEDPADKATAQQVLVHVLGSILRLLHPVMPFITEEIYQKLPAHAESIMQASWPKPVEAFDDQQAEEEVEVLKDLTVIVRQIRSFMRIAPSVKLDIYVFSREGSRIELVLKNQEYLRKLATIGEICVLETKSEVHNMAYGVQKGLEVFVPLQGIVDIDAERSRIEKDLKKFSAEFETIHRKLSNDDFLGKAPELVIEKEKEKFAELDEKINKIKQQLSVM